MFVFIVYILTDLDVHPEEANIDTILLLEGKHGSGSVGEVIHHITSINISKQVVLKYFSELWKYFFGDFNIFTFVSSQA